MSFFFEKTPSYMEELFSYLLIPRKAVYTAFGTLYGQGGDLSAALLLPASSYPSGQVNRWRIVGGLQTTP